MKWSTQAQPELRPGATGLKGSDAPLARSTPEANAIAHGRDDRMRDRRDQTAMRIGICALIVSARRSTSQSQKGSTAALPMASQPIGKNFLRTI